MTYDTYSYTNSSTHNMANPLIQNIAINRNPNYSNYHASKDTNFKRHNDDVFDEQPEMRFGNQLYTNDSWGSNSSLESLNLILEKQRKQQLNNPLHQTHIFLPVKIKLEYDPITKKTMLNHYEIIKEMGQGQFGKVKLVKNMNTNELNAMKIVNKHSNNTPKRFSLEANQPSTNDSLDPKSINGNQKNDRSVFSQNLIDHGVSDDKIRNEVTIMKLLNNKNITRLIEVLNDPESKKIYLILEYCAHGEIKWCSGDQLEINAKGPSLLSFDKSKDYFRQVVLGLEYLQMKNVLHRDLKPANLLLTANDVVKISDFGCSLLLNDCAEEDLIKTVGTPVFYAPEICISNAVSFYKTKSIRQIISFSLDIWSLGITLYCFLFGKLPFNSNHEMKLFEIICHGKLEFPINVPDVDVRQLLQAQNILLKLLDKNPLTRITIEEIKNHSFTLDGLSESQRNAFLNDKIQSSDYSDIDYDDFLAHDDYSNQRDHYDLGLSDNNRRTHSKLINADNRLVSLPLNSSFASLDSFYIDRNASMLARNNAKAADNDLGVNIDINNSFIPKTLRQFNPGKRLSLDSTGIVQRAFDKKFNKRADKKSLDLNRANPEHSVPRSHYLPQNSSINSSTIDGHVESKHWKYDNDQSDSDSDDNGFDDHFEYTGYYKNDNYPNDIGLENFSETESLPFEFKEDSDHEDAVYDQMKTNMAHLESTDMVNPSGPQYNNSKSNVYMVDALYTNGNSTMNEHLNKVSDSHPGHGKKKGNLIFMDSSDDEEDEEVFYQSDIRKEYTLLDNNPSSASRLSLRKVIEQEVIHNSSQSSSLSAMVDLQGIQQVDIPEDVLMQMNPGGVDLRKNYSEQATMKDHSVSVDDTRRIHSVSDLKKIRSNNGPLNFKPTMSNVLMKKSGPINNQLFSSRFSPLQTSRSADITNSFTTECTKTTANSVLHRTMASAKVEDNEGKQYSKQVPEQTNNITSVDILQSFIYDEKS